MTAPPRWRASGWTPSWAFCTAIGPEPSGGFMARALDLMEELRGPLADRLVLTLINTRAIQAKHFQRQAHGAVYLSDDGRKLFLNAWQERKRETLTHPYLKEKIYWGLVPYVQALLLARCLRGDLDGYPPFLWK